MEQPKKYIKVMVSEIPPSGSGKYLTQLGECEFYSQWNEFYHIGLGITAYPDFYFVEVPDRESELIEMLEESSKTIKSLKLSMLAHPDYTEGSEFDDLTSIARDQENEIDSLIQSVKQPK